MLTIYGKRQSRAGRCLWALEELGLPYRQVPVDAAAGETRTQAHLALNPMGKVPVLVDGDFVLTESIAINHYLVAKAPTPLWPADLRAQAQIVRWSNWAVTEVEFHFTSIVREMRRDGGADQARIADSLAAVAATMKALEQHLSGGAPYVAGDTFTIGDVNAAFPVMGVSARIDMMPFPASRAWLERCVARPAWQRVLAIDEAALPAGA